ncbi:MAG: Type I restriction enzyme EcoKI specificity protein [Candidatus Accumulibacter adjunctus]|uniref:Type I restriction enzyme EcoKI specificity protein n=1 Tax=Candidatus Accumulibacter adjunctus TaxID=1454001 RepID=A0A011NYF3_9PROT|nr:MAG: Type I restriction enzyme EcoKI specificity protein [Candidatus Accumulibacter adjunctus]
MKREARLGDVVVSMKNGLYKPASEYADDGTPCLRMYNIDAGSIVWRDIKRMHVSAAELDEYGLREGDLLVNRVNSRELVGKAAFIPSSLEPSVFESKNIRVRLDASKAVPKFINYQLLAGSRRHFAGHAQQVVGMASISQKQLADFPIILADLDEQCCIVAELEKQFSRLDEAVANLKRVKANLDRYVGATLGEAFSGKWAGTEADWQSVPLREVADVQLGQQRAPVHAADANPIPYVRAANVSWQGLDLSDVKSMGFPNAARYRLAYGDILLAEASGSANEVGKPAIWRDEIPGACYQKTLIRVRCQPDRLNFEFAYYFFLHAALSGQFARLAPGVGILHLTAERMLVWPTVAPTLRIQAVVVAEVDRRLSIVREVEAEVDANLMRAQALRQAVLAKAFAA